MTYVGHLTVGVLPCDSHVNYVTLKHLQILLFKCKIIHNFIYPHIDFLKAKLNVENSQYALKQHMHTILQLDTSLYFKYATF